MKLFGLRFMTPSRKMELIRGEQMYQCVRAMRPSAGAVLVMLVRLQVAAAVVSDLQVHPSPR